MTDLEKRAVVISAAGAFGGAFETELIEEAGIVDFRRFANAARENYT
jgi:hypothetical protein